MDLKNKTCYLCSFKTQRCCCLALSLFFFKLESLMNTVPKFITLFQLPFTVCFWGLQYLSVDPKITANPISASGIGLRSLLLKIKHSFRKLCFKRQPRLTVLSEDTNYFAYHCYGLILRGKTEVINWLQALYLNTLCFVSVFVYCLAQQNLTPGWSLNTTKRNVIINNNNVGCKNLPLQLISY